MARPTIASLTAQVEHWKSMHADAVERERANARATKAATDELSGVRAGLDQMKSDLDEAHAIAAYWMGRAHQAVGIPDDQQGRRIYDLVSVPAPNANGYYR